jgi:hypothetical protein
MLTVTNAECNTKLPYAEYHYAEYRYAECRYAQCHGALFITAVKRFTVVMSETFFQPSVM